MRWSDLAGRRLLILGTGREARAVADALEGRAGSLLAADEHDGDSARAWRADYGDRVPLSIGPVAAELSGVDVAIASPGIPPHSRLRSLVAELGIPETTGTDLWLGENASRTTAVTGSKGKSTTASLIHALNLAHGVGSALGGNIGLPLLSLSPADRYVAELSSYQSSSVTRSPDVVVITSLFPEHLDWHGSEADYYAAKLNLAGHGARRVLVNGRDERLAAAVATGLPGIPVDTVAGTGSRWGLLDEGGSTWIARDGTPFVALDGFPLLGRHNALNAALALAAVDAAGVAPDAEAAIDALRSFRGLEHRLEGIHDPSGLLFVDDSLSTSPYAAVAALDALDERRVVILLGGHDRGVDYAPLAAHLAEHPVAGVVGLPDSGERILAELATVGVPGIVVDGMDEAVVAARAIAPADGIVLLSPAAPSYGRYRDFADRAADFRRAIAATASVTPPASPASVEDPSPDTPADPGLAPEEGTP